METTITITLADGMRIIVPDSLNLLTAYVLQEQEDWFEDEIKFLRQLVRPGSNVIDIGANYGVYTLSLANLVGPAGRVWAFEPASRTAGLLSASIAANGLGNVLVEQTALSSEAGTARLALNDNSELNALVHDPASTGNIETVKITTLDECLERHRWKAIEFVKLDAEGEEEKILRGGSVFLAVESPLIQYEVMAGTKLHLELIEAFAAIGYKSYRLVPGLDLLVPFDTKDPVDGYLLNLFACKPERAADLVARGLLAGQKVADKFRETHCTEIASHSKAALTDSWLPALEKLPYGKMCSGSWRRTLAANGNPELNAAMYLYAKSRNLSLTGSERFAALEECYLYLKSLCELQPSHLRLSSLARVAREYGAREVATGALGQLARAIIERRQVDLTEPFLAPGERFDSLPLQNNIGNWIAAATLEEFERQSAFSSYYTGATALQRLRAIESLGFGSAEMKRRLDLVQRRFAGTVTQANTQKQ